VLAVLHVSGVLQLIAETCIHFLPFAGAAGVSPVPLPITCYLTIECSSSDILWHSQDATVAMQGLLGVELHDVSNIIVMQRSLEKKFDNWEWTILPQDEDQYMVSQQLQRCKYPLCSRCTLHYFTLVCKMTAQLLGSCRSLCRPFMRVPREALSGSARRLTSETHDVLRGTIQLLLLPGTSS
jgi:hypothetical protein